MARTYLYLIFALLAHNVHCLYNPPPSNCTYSPNAKAFNCGIPGPGHRSFRDGDPQQVTDRDDCIYLCHRREGLGSDRFGCKSFTFDSQTGLCQLYTKRFKNFSVDTNSSNVYFELRCFRCKPKCPVPLRQNLLDNGDFEASADYLGPWSSYGYGDVGIASPGHDSQYAYSYNATTSDYDSVAASVSQSINYYNCDSGITYTLQFDFKITPAGPNSSSNLYANWGSTTSYQFGGLPNGTHGKWKTIVTPYNNDDSGIYTGETSGVGFTVNGAQGSLSTLGNYLIDNVSIVATRQNLTVQPGTPELLKNAGFETGKLQPWSVPSAVHSSYSITSPGVTGSHAFTFYYKDITSVLYLQQEVQTVPGDRYLFSVDSVNLVNDFAFDVIFGSFGLTGSGGDDYVENSINARKSKSMAAPQHYETQFIAQSETTIVTLQFTGDTGPNNITFDNFSIKELS